MPRARTWSVADVLRELELGLRELGARWYLFGAQALVLRGCPRATADIDVTVLLGPRTPATLIETLRQRRFELRFGDAAFVETTFVLPVIHAPSGFPVDVVLGGPGVEERFADAAETMRVGRARVPVATATHLVVMKLLAGRSKDLDDAVRLLATEPCEVDAKELETLVRMLAEAVEDDTIARNLDDVRARIAASRARSRTPPRRRRPPRGAKPEGGRNR